MIQKPDASSQHLSQLVELSVNSLQDVDRRLRRARSELADLIGRTAALQQAGGLPPAGPAGGAGAGLPPFLAGDPIAPALGPGQGPPGPPLRPPLGAAFLPPLGPAFGLGPGPGPSPGQLLGMGPAFGMAAGLGFGPLGASLGSPVGGFDPSLGGGMAPASRYGQPPEQGGGYGGGAGPAQSARELQHMPPMTRVPTVDLVDQGQEFLVQVELPGVKKDDLDILVSERAVTIHGSTRPEVGEGALLLNERGPVVYRRLIPLPSEIHTTQSKAVFKDGILTLTVPKKAPTEGPRRLDVAFS